MIRQPSMFKDAELYKSFAVKLSMAGGYQEIKQTTRIFEPITEALKAVRVRTKDLSGVFDIIAQIVLEGMKETLETAGKTTGTAWEPLSKSTLLERKKRGTSKGAIFPEQPILNETGQYFNSIKVIRKSLKTLNMGTYNPYHHEWAKRTRYRGKTVEIPARPLLVLTENMLREILLFLQSTLDSLLEGDPNKARFMRSRRAMAIYSPPSRLKSSSLNSVTDGGVDF